MIPLLEKFKGETGTKYHLLMTVPVTNSGLNPQYWVECRVDLLQMEGKISGPALCNIYSHSLQGRDMENEFHVQLNCIKENSSGLIPMDNQVEEMHGINRLFRCGSNYQKMDQLVLDSIIQLINR